MNVELLLAIYMLVQAAAQASGLTVGALNIPWSTVVLIAGGGAAWATLRANVRAARAIAGEAKAAATSAEKGVNRLEVSVGKVESDVESVWRELDRMNRTLENRR